MQEKIFTSIEGIKEEILKISDYIYDNPELGNEEHKACKILSDFLESKNFSLERGVAGLETSFVASYKNGDGGPVIGLLCEYDALPELGHGCAHHMQGSVMIGAALAIIDVLKNYPFHLKVIGTPAEETTGGKLEMIKHNIFEGIDVVLMVHGSDRTTVDCKAMAMSKFDFKFKGKSSHAAIAPDQGVSALDGLLLMFNGIEFLREHVRDDVRIHGIITNGGKAANVVPEEAAAQFYVRAEDRFYLDKVIQRVKNVVEGCAMATGTVAEINEIKSLDNKISIDSLNALLLKNAQAAEAWNVTPPREKTGSTDFSSVMYRIPGASLRLAFVPQGISSHTQEWVDSGKSEKLYEAVIFGAKSIALTAADLIVQEDILKAVKDEFKEKKEKESKNYI